MAGAPGTGKTVFELSFLTVCVCVCAGAVVNDSNLFVVVVLVVGVRFVTIEVIMFMIWIGPPHLPPLMPSRQRIVVTGISKFLLRLFLLLLLLLLLSMLLLMPLPMLLLLQLDLLLWLQ